VMAYPLGNRQVIFVDTTVYELPLNGMTGGEIDPPIVTTDGSGKATVKFTAGHENGFAQIMAWYPHKKPCGRSAAFEGTAVVAIQPPPPGLWVVNVTYK